MRSLRKADYNRRSSRPDFSTMVLRSSLLRRREQENRSVGMLGRDSMRYVHIFRIVPFLLAFIAGIAAVGAAGIMQYGFPSIKLRGLSQPSIKLRGLSQPARGLASPAAKPTCFI